MTDDLARWFDRQAAREQRAVLLEDALLGGRFLAYVRYRLRWWLARYALASVVQVVQVLVLHRLFAHESFLVLIGLLAGAGLAISAWWGALEVLRTRVRDLYRTGAPHHVPAEIGWWLSGAIRIGLVLGIVAIAFLVFRALTSSVGVGPVDLAASAILVRVAVDIPRRCYHSGIYALRRVYRPLPSILALEVVSVAALVGLAPLLGAWAAPLAELISISAVTAISVVFTARAYRLAGLAPQRYLRLPGVRGLSRRRRPSRGGDRPSIQLILRSATPPAAAAACMSLDSFVVPVVFGVAGESGIGWASAVLVASVAPSLRAGFDWSQLLYFDLKRLEARPFANLRDRFVADATRIAPFLAIGFWVVSGAITSLVLGGVPVRFELQLLPFFIAASFLSLGQIDAFTSERYGHAVAGGAALGAGLLAIGPLSGLGIGPLVGLDVAAIGALAVFVLTGRIGRARSGVAGDVLVPTEWLDRLARESGPLVVATTRFGPPPATRTAEEERAASWRRQGVARRIARRLGRNGAATSVGTDGLAWYERTGPRPRRADRAWLVRTLGGLVRDFREAEAPDGRTAAATVADWGTFGRLPVAGPDAPIEGGSPAEPRAITAERLVETFRSSFPDGVVHEPDRPAPSRLRERTARERRAILAEASRFAQGLPPRYRGLPFEVSAWCPSGRLRLIFLVERATTARADRAVWRAVLRGAHLQPAITEERTSRRTL